MRSRQRRRRFRGYHHYRGNDGRRFITFVILDGWLVFGSTVIVTVTVSPSFVIVACVIISLPVLIFAIRSVTVDGMATRRFVASMVLCDGVSFGSTIVGRTGASFRILVILVFVVGVGSAAAFVGMTIFSMVMSHLLGTDLTLDGLNL